MRKSFRSHSTLDIELVRREHLRMTSFDTKRFHQTVKRALSLAQAIEDQEIDDEDTIAEMRGILYELKQRVRELVRVRKEELELCDLELELFEELAPGAHLRLVSAATS